MEKTTIETMKSVIQDWFAERETRDEVFELTFILHDEITKQSLAMLKQRRKT